MFISYVFKFQIRISRSGSENFAVLKVEMRSIYSFTVCGCNIKISIEVKIKSFKPLLLVDVERRLEILLESVNIRGRQAPLRA